MSSGNCDDGHDPPTLKLTGNDVTSTVGIVPIDGSVTGMTEGTPISEIDG